MAIAALVLSNVAVLLTILALSSAGSAHASVLKLREELKK